MVATLRQEDEEAIYGDNDDYVELSQEELIKKIKKDKIYDEKWVLINNNGDFVEKCVLNRLLR